MLFKENEDPDVLYIVREGEVKLVRIVRVQKYDQTENKQKRMKGYCKMEQKGIKQSGQFIGEFDILYNKQRQYNAVNNSQMSLVWAIERNQFIQFIKKNNLVKRFQNIVEQNYLVQMQNQKTVEQSQMDELLQSSLQFVQSDNDQEIVYVKEQLKEQKSNNVLERQSFLYFNKPKQSKKMTIDSLDIKLSRSVLLSQKSNENNTNRSEIQNNNNNSNNQKVGLLDDNKKDRKTIVDLIGCYQRKIDYLNRKKQRINSEKKEQDESIRSMRQDVHYFRVKKMKQLLYADDQKLGQYHRKNKQNRRLLYQQF